MFWESRQTKTKQDRQCSFCGKRQGAVKSLIQSPATHQCSSCQADSTLLICNECVTLCSTLLLDEQAEQAAKTNGAAWTALMACMATNRRVCGSVAGSDVSDNTGGRWGDLRVVDEWAYLPVGVAPRAQCGRSKR